MKAEAEAEAEVKGDGKRASAEVNALSSAIDVGLAIAD